MIDVRHVAGVDVAYDEEQRQMFSAAVVLDANLLEVVEFATAREEVSFPYIPGLFAFRELPAVVKSLEKLKITPDLIVCDGQGIAHPRRFGLASHLGVLFDIPTIGCSKTKLIGEGSEPGCYRGDLTPLLDKGETIGCVLRTQNNIKPVYISIGHRVTLRSACEWVLRLSPKHRLPETTRQSDHIAKMHKKMNFT